MGNGTALRGEKQGAVHGNARGNTEGSAGQRVGKTRDKARSNARGNTPGNAGSGCSAPPRRPPSPSPAHLPRAAPRAAPRASRRPWHRPAPRRSPPRCPSLPAPRLGPSSVRRQRGSPRLPPRPAALTAGPEVPPGGATPWGSGPGAAYRGEPPGGCGTAIVRPPRRGRAGRSAAGIYSSLWPPARRPLSCRCFSRTDPSNFEAASPSGRNEP